VEAGNELHDAYDGGSEVVDGYEQLRARALCGDVGGWRLGLGVLAPNGKKTLQILPRGQWIALIPDAHPATSAGTTTRPTRSCC
jgi:hypothetical protein